MKTGQIVTERHLQEILPEESIPGRNESACQAEPVLKTLELFFSVNGTTILEDINLSFPKNKVTAIIGPSGSGKTTLLRCFNRMNDSVRKSSVKGTILFKEKDITNGCDVYSLRREIGMVFQKPTIFPKSIHQNVLFGLEHFHLAEKNKHAEIVEKKLRQVSLWNEVNSRLHNTAIGLSHGQQQRLCIARTLALEPEVLLLDEPTSALDPKSTDAIEDLIVSLKENRTVILITHNLSQAKRVADQVVFICNGKICETGEAKNFFTNPCKNETQEYIGKC